MENSSYDPFILAAVACLFLLVRLAPAVLPALRATSIDPVQALVMSNPEAVAFFHR